MAKNSGGWFPTRNVIKACNECIQCIEEKRATKAERIIRRHLNSPARRCFNWLLGPRTYKDAQAIYEDSWDRFHVICINGQQLDTAQTILNLAECTHRTEVWISNDDFAYIAPFYERNID